MTIYHATQPHTSKDFDDNGDEDEFNPNPDPTSPTYAFWGKRRTNQQKFGGVADSPCYYMYTVSTYRMGIKFKTEHFVPDYSNPVPC